jgi:hypothetical protein
MIQNTDNHYNTEAVARVGVIWNEIPFDTEVIPAQAAIQSVSSASPKVCGVDSRLRGNDRDLPHPYLANDTNAAAVKCFYPVAGRGIMVSF